MKIINKLANTDVIILAPPAKAHTLRALIIGSLADGKSTIHNPLLGEDQLNLIECLRGLGIEIYREAEKLIVNGLAGRYAPISEEIDVGESGVGMNFLASAACLSSTPLVITGSQRIRERPVFEVVEGLRQLGCRIEYLNRQGFPPLRLDSNGIKGGCARIKGEKTSQYFSSIAISSPYADNEVTLECISAMTEKPYFDITLQMMSEFRIDAHNDGYKRITIPNDTKYRPKEIHIEGDYSSASFFFLAAAICSSKVTVRGLNPKSKQGDKEFLAILAQMGCKVSETDDGICVEGRRLNPIEKDMSNFPDLVPPSAIAAAFANGTSTFNNVGHLRYKECDRLAAIVSELGKMGVSAKSDESSLTVAGSDNAHGAQINPHNDHRIAMSFAVAGLATGDQTIDNEMCVAKSFPDFWERFKTFG